MTLLQHAFAVRAALRDALHPRATIIYKDQDSLVVGAPLRENGSCATVRIQLDYSLNHITASGSLDDGLKRSFRLTPTNLHGYLGLLDAHQDSPVGRLTALAWTEIQTRNLLNNSFGWTIPSGQPPRAKPVHVTAPLHPRSHRQDDLLRNPKPYPRYKVFHDHASDEWTYARLHPNGRDLDPHSSTTFHDAQAAMNAAELDAIRNGHLPVSPDPLHVLIWTSLYGDDEHDILHTALLSNGSKVEVSASADSIDDNLTWCVTQRENNGAEHGGSSYFDSEDEALHAAVALLNQNPH